MGLGMDLTGRLEGKPVKPTVKKYNHARRTKLFSLCQEFSCVG